MTAGGGDLLALLHPDGVAMRAGTLGEGCPARLRPPGGGGASADLLVVAPSAREARSPEWIAGTARQVATALDRDGIAYVVAAPRARARLRAALEREGLAVGESVLHLPDPAASELLVPLRPEALRGAAERLLVAGSGRRRAVALMLAAPGSLALLGRLHPGVGLVVRRPGARPTAAWLGAGRIAAIQTRWRPDRATAAVHLLPGGSGPAVAKVALGEADGAGRLRDEAATLSSLGPAARGAGASVPVGAALERPGASAALVLDLVTGIPAARLLARHPDRCEMVLRRLAAWLEAWSRATAHPQVVGRSRIESWIAPARRLADQIDGGHDYAAWLESRALGLEGHTVPAVACHNDLTMANVLVDGGARLGVIDWESADGEGLPLGDLVYAAVDATAAAERYRDRPAAFDRCFGRGRAAGAPRELLARLQKAVDMPQAYATLAFHACWLRHAENEARKRLPGEARPFLEIVRRAAANRIEP